MKFRITKLEGKHFEARFLIGRNIDRTVRGAYDGINIQWKASDVTANSGAAGGDNAGVIKKDENGYQIDFEYRDPNGAGGKFTLRPKVK